MHNPTLRVISILNALSNSQNGFTVSEMSKLLEIPLGTISPILKTLVNNRFLEFDYETNKYSIGVQSYFVGSSFISKNSALEVIREEIQNLSLICGETCQLGILKENRVFYLMKVEGGESIRIVSDVGGTLPAYATALGKTLLSNMDSEELENYYDNIEFLRLTENTIYDVETLKHQIADIKENGFGFEQGESNENAACIAIPIFQNNKCVASVSVVYPIFKNSEEKIAKLKNYLIDCRNNIEKVLLIHNIL